MSDVRYLRWLRRLSVIPRWSVVPVLRRQSVAEHSFHVSTLALWLVRLHARRDDGKFELEVLRYALTHDIGEASTGDAPSPSKPKSKASHEDQVKVLVKCADLIESIMFMHEESLLGNRMGMDYIVDRVYNEFVDWWRHFDTGDKNIHSAEVISTAKLICFNEINPHPAVEEGQECLPLKSNG
jgi:hypothetical protein